MGRLAADGQEREAEDDQTAEAGCALCLVSQPFDDAALEHAREKH
jgi:hypothetical protein